MTLETSAMPLRFTTFCKVIILLANMEQVNSFTLAKAYNRQCLFVFVHTLTQAGTASPSLGSMLFTRTTAHEVKSIGRIMAPC